MIRTTGSLPLKAKMNDGTELELFIRRQTRGKGYIATLWVIINDVQEHIFEYATGTNIEEAKSNLKNKLLRMK